MDPRLKHILRDLSMLLLGLGGWILWFWVYFRAIPPDGIFSDGYISNTLEMNNFGEFWWEFVLLCGILIIYAYWIFTQDRYWRRLT